MCPCVESKKKIQAREKEQKSETDFEQKSVALPALSRLSSGKYVRYKINGKKKKNYYTKH